MTPRSTSRADGERVFSAYLERHARCDLEGVLALFEPRAEVEDPVGGGIDRGAEAIRSFYSGTQKRNGPMTFERVGPVLVGGGEFVAHVRAELEKAGSPPAMDVIYVIRLSEAGKIESLRAWY